MKGSIDKYTTRGSSKPHWRYRIYRGKDLVGKKLWETRAGFKKEADATKALRDRITELAQQAGNPTGSMDTFGEYLSGWLDRAAERCERKTIERYRELASYV